MSLNALYATLQPTGDLPALAGLRHRFLTHATAGARYLDDAPALAAYRAFFFPQTFARVGSVLSELPDFHPHTVVDLGAAMAPASFAAHLHAGAETLFAVDFSARALQDAERLAEIIGAKLHTATHDLSNGWPAAAPARADLVIAANALSELKEHKDRLALATHVLKERLTTAGALILIEPADRMHARDLQRLRDALGQNGMHAILPCPHDAACPALVRERDFCHEARALTLPAWFPALAKSAGLSDCRQRFSYLVYRPSAPAHINTQRIRIISHPIEDKGRLRYFACAESGLVELMRQTKNASASNAAFARLGRGALIRTDAPATGSAPQRIKIEASSTLVLDSAGDPHGSL